MYNRDLQKTIKSYSKFPVIAILGPRQSGKTTIAKLTFPNHKFISFEDPLVREFANNEPKQFLKTHHNAKGMIIDEFQYVPKLLSYIQLDVDENDRKNYFILTGSQNFLMNQTITQSLAGRVGILTLLPLSLNELLQNNLISNQVAEVIFNGCYPRLYKEQFTPQNLYPSYIHTYLERDVRTLINVGDLNTFQKFLQLCAGRVGNLLNLSDLATICGISLTTTRRWISTLQASYIIFLLEPHFKNFNKRLTKMPKLYFYDTGLVCSLLRIPSAEQLVLNPLWGSIFECFILADFTKQYFNAGIRSPLYFWRDKNGRLEIDCLIDEGGKLIPIEIKSGESITIKLFDSLQKWNILAQTTAANNYLIYAGKQRQPRSIGTVIPWQESAKLIAELRV